MSWGRKANCSACDREAVEAIRGLTVAVQQNTEQLALLWQRVARVDGRLDGLERWAADHLPDYPRDRHPDSTLVATHGRITR